MKIRNVNLYNYVFIYTSNCELILFNAGEKVLIPFNTIAILEKNITFDVECVRLGNGILYQHFELDDSTLLSLRSIYEPLIKIDAEYLTKKRGFTEMVFKVKTDDTLINLFGKLINSYHSDISRMYKIAYLTSKCEDATKLAMSLYRTAAISCKEKIARELATDISKKWKLSDLAEAFHVSEISIRKKLESEGVNFNQLLLDVRMNHAAKLIVRSNKQINMIANSVGYTSISYFIKVFKDYYGITPKQFEIALKENLTSK
ncbi:TPA: helix-turn-helix transcriptional regulator [Escherichia coli]|nr:helix-turn-helix transcriptional regulator [Escherichia coli]